MSDSVRVRIGQDTVNVTIIDSTGEVFMYSARIVHSAENFL